MSTKRSTEMQPASKVPERPTLYPCSHQPSSHCATSAKRRAAERILAATTQVVRAGENVTEDLGGQASTATMAEAIVAAM